MIKKSAWVILILFTSVGLALAANTASDNSSNSGGVFNNGDNGGTGFGAWTFSGAGNFFGGFIGDSTQNGRESINVGVPAAAFALFANTNGAFINAERQFTGGALGVGQTMSFQMNYSWNGGNRGFSLLDGGTEVLNINHGGAGDALFVGGNQAFASVFGRAITFTITATDATHLSVISAGVEAVGTNTQNVLVSALPDRFKFYYANGNPNALTDESNYEPYFNNLNVTPPIPEPGTTSLILGGGLFGLISLIRRHYLG